LIQWEGRLHPAHALPESGCKLQRFTREGGVLEANFATAAGMRTI
jgi:hypothetical protein